MKSRNIFGMIVLGLFAAGIIMSLQDIKRYIRISAM